MIDDLMNFGIYIFINSFAEYYLFVKFIKQNLLGEFRLFNYYMCKHYYTTEFIINTLLLFILFWENNNMTSIVRKMIRIEIKSWMI